MAQSNAKANQLETYPWGLREYATRAINLAQRTIYGRWFKRFSDFAHLPYDYEGEACSNAICDMLTADKPCMIARFGANEMMVTLRTKSIMEKKTALGQFGKILLGKAAPFWWDNAIRGSMSWVAGYFPDDNASFERYGKRILEDCKQIDLLGAWQCGEKMLKKIYFPKARAMPLQMLEPFWTRDPWTGGVLEGKRILVIHPFDETIKRQYTKSRIRSIHRDPRILPEFELLTYRSVQSIAGNWPVEFDSWFDALEKMCEDISKIDFEIAIIGAGAYGMSLAAFIKRDLHKKAFHLGGATQLLFGIKGGRYDASASYRENLYTEDWVRPSERPARCDTAENGAYW